MLYYANPRNYPIQLFPDGIRQAILTMHAQTKAPLEINAASVLATTSLATQHLSLVRRPTGQISPISLALLTLAASGDRKSSSDDVAFVAIRAHETAQAEQHRQAMERYDVDFIAWKAQRDGIALQIKFCTAKGKPTEALLAQMTELLSRKPSRPKFTKLVYADATPEALAFGMYRNSPSAALVSNEASKLLFGPTMSNLAMFSELWSGGEVTIDRVSSESFVLKNNVLTTSLMVQPSEFDRYLKTRGAHMRGSGYLARCLVARPQSIQGFREIFPGELIPTEDTDRFHTRITELLRTNGSHLTGHAITFNEQAGWEWTNFFNEIERNQRQNQIYADIGDFASKIADNASRLAAIFNHYEGNGDLITLDSTRRAVEICKWYLSEFKMIFGDQYQATEEQQNAMALDQWAAKLGRAADGFVYIDRSKIMQFGPNRLRSRALLSKTLEYMALCGRAAWWMDGRKTVVRFSPWSTW